MTHRRTIPIVIGLMLVALAGCRRKVAATGNPAVDNKVTQRVARLYFESAGALLTAEPHQLPLPENPAAAMPLVVRELVKGPANPALTPTLPADVVVRGTFLLPDGTAFVDLGGTTLSQGWATGSHQELIGIYSIVQTLCANFPEAKRVRLLVNGAPAETLGGHITLDRALKPDLTLVATDSR